MAGILEVEFWFAAEKGILAHLLCLTSFTKQKEKHFPFFTFNTNNINLMAIQALYKVCPQY